MKLNITNINTAPSSAGRFLRIFLAGIMLACGLNCYAGFVGHRTAMVLNFAGVDGANNMLVFTGRLSYLSNQGRTGVLGATIQMTIKEGGANNPILYAETIAPQMDGSFVWYVPRNAVPPRFNNRNTGYRCVADYAGGGQIRPNYMEFENSKAWRDIFVSPNGFVH